METNDVVWLMTLIAELVAQIEDTDNDQDVRDNLTRLIGSKMSGDGMLAAYDRAAAILDTFRPSID